MTRKVVITYTMLFLFAFTFAFAFAMEAKAEDPGDICCVVTACASNPRYFDVQGHIDDEGYCVHDQSSLCDIYGICPNPGP